MGKNKNRGAEGGGAPSSSSSSRGYGIVGAAVVVSFAVGFGAALQLSSALCHGNAAPASLDFLRPHVCHTGSAGSKGSKSKAAKGAPGITKASSNADDIPPRKSPPPIKAEAMTPPPKRSPGTKGDVGPGGVGAASGVDPWAQTTHPGMASSGWNWTQLSMSRAGNFPPGGAKRLSKEMVKDKGGMWVWHTTYARSIPAVVEGLASDFAAKFADWTFADFRKYWGGNRVVVAFSDDERFNRGVADETYGRLIQHPDRQQMTFAEYLDLAENPRPDEHVSVQQSPSSDFSEWSLPPLPPGLEDVVKYTLSSRNFWAATPPKVSVLHYDWTDSVLLQITGTKRFTIIDPARMHTAYPCVAFLAQLKRVAPGKFERVLSPRELDNFPLVNVTHPDLSRHPLFAEASPFTVELNPGDALILPAYWYHQVESFAPPGGINVAVNYWFQGHSLATRLYRTMRENLFLNCTEPATPGVPHICRD